MEQQKAINTIWNTHLDRMLEMECVDGKMKASNLKNMSEQPPIGRPCKSGLRPKLIGMAAYMRLYKPKKKTAQKNKTGLSPKLMGRIEYTRLWRQIRFYSRGLTSKGKVRRNKMPSNNYSELLRKYLDESQTA